MEKTAVGIIGVKHFMMQKAVKNLIANLIAPYKLNNGKEQYFFKTFIRP